MDNLATVQNIIDTLLEKGFGDMYKAEYTILSDTEIKINITGNGVSYLIGQYGRTLLALQHIIRQMYIATTEDFNEATKLIIDVDGYKDKRVERIKEFAKNAADKCLSLDIAVTLPTMTSFERHVVHEMIQENYPDLVTESVGEEPNRRVMLKKREG